MARFLFIFRSEHDAHYKMTPEQMQQNHEKWVKWLGDGVKDGWVVDVGDGLKGEGRVIAAGQVVKDGPFVESREVVGGFTIVEAAGIEAAVELGKGCPILQSGGVGGSVEVRPLWGFTLE
jgi:hypothetical protein